MADEDPGVLGNLPRSRPGRRSAKRGTAGGPAKTAAAKRTAAKRSAPKAAASKPRAAAKPRTTAKPRAAASRPRSAPPRQRPAPPPPPVSQPGADPVGDAIRVAGKIADLGLKTAGGLLKRLPGR